MRIELYLDSEEYTTGRGTRPSLRQSGGVPAADYEDGNRANQRFVEPPPEVIKLRGMLENIARRHDVEFIVYDRLRIHDSVRAFFKGVKKIPTVIIGKRKFIGTGITEEEVEKAIISE